MRRGFADAREIKPRVVAATARIILKDAILLAFSCSV